MEKEKMDVYECQTSGIEIFEKDVTALILVDLKIHTNIESVKDELSKAKLPKPLNGINFCKDTLKKTQNHVSCNGKFNEPEIAEGIRFFGFVPTI